MKSLQCKITSYKLLLLALFLLNNSINAQLKFVVEDFEGCTDGSSDLKANGIFSFGNIKVNIERHPIDSYRGAYSGERFLKINKEEKLDYGGCGKGIGLNIELDFKEDYLNFYLRFPETATINIELQEDDNGDNVHKKNGDDSWIYIQEVLPKNVPNEWVLISIPLNKFKDSNPSGDGIFNINYKEGKLLSLIISFIETSERQTGMEHVKNNDQEVSEGRKEYSFDFICFSKGKLPTGSGLFDAPSAATSGHCSLGAWSKEGNTADFIDIANNFEKIFEYGSKKKLGVIHFFQPFSVDGGNIENHYPSVERINKVIQQGYIPLITLEDHFVNASSTTQQPTLKNIVDGYFDVFIGEWAKQIKQVDGAVLLRILHEFNGDWYPWCIVNNHKDPRLIVKAFRHIHNIFTAENVTNVKFIWCPNSMSIPQEKWNFIMDAYPGNEYVDFVGLDIYNGAGKGVPVWRSFRKEGIENYFILTQALPDKPLFICETASRERGGTESKLSQNKSEWIKQMSEAIHSDMSKIILLTWFNEKSSFKINSSSEAQKAFLNSILKNDYFKSGTEYMYRILKQ